MRVLATVQASDGQWAALLPVAVRCPTRQAARAVHEICSATAIFWKAPLNVPTVALEVLTIGL
jgi:hypothetical protein